ncbi:unknown [Prevotella sp. CAG:487]|nr:unknown [Prevotella sp. CAG:487]
MYQPCMSHVRLAMKASFPDISLNGRMGNSFSSSVPSLRVTTSNSTQSVSEYSVKTSTLLRSASGSSQSSLSTNVMYFPPARLSPTLRACACPRFSFSDITSIRGSVSAYLLSISSDSSVEQSSIHIICMSFSVCARSESIQRLIYFAELYTATRTDT